MPARAGRRDRVRSGRRGGLRQVASQSSLSASRTRAIRRQPSGIEASTLINALDRTPSPPLMAEV